MTIVVYKGSIKDAVHLYSYEGFVPRKGELITIENETYVVNAIQHDFNENTTRVFVNIYDWE